MSKVTILGAGIIGMSIASQLPKDTEITIVGGFLPGDELDKEYTSQWAGAIWLGSREATARQQQMQLGGLSGLWRLAERHPESSVRKVTMTEINDYGSIQDVWYRDYVPDFQQIPQRELPAGAKYGLKYTSLVITPVVFIKWMRARLEARGVVFKRLHIKALSDLRGMGHDVLVNASGWGATKLEDVLEKRLIPIRQQNLRIRKGGYNGLYIRRGENGYYSTAFGRHDGTIYIGGIREPGIHDLTTYEDQRRTIMRHAHENNPQLFPSPNPMDYDFICDHTGEFHYIKDEEGGVRVEKEIIGGQSVVHAYGMEMGGFVYSFGLARDAARLVGDFLFELPESSH